MNKIKAETRKPVYLGLSTLEISKTLTKEFWYNYIKPKYQSIIGLMKDDLGGKITTEFLVLRLKTYSYLRMMVIVMKN